MSITTTSSDEDNTNPPTTPTDPTRKPRYKRRKIAIFFAYCGVGYQGMQKNPGAKTIESDLEEALFLSGAVPEPDKRNPNRYDWARCARTDKGVSAVGQVVSGRFYIGPPGLVQRLNENLSPQIRVFGFKRVTAPFNAKKCCDRRRYVYLIPVFALDPSSHPDRESVLASVGSGNDLVKCVECSERGRKVVGVMGRRGFEGKSHLDILSNTEGALVRSRVKEDIDAPMGNSVDPKGIESKGDGVVSLGVDDGVVSSGIIEDGVGPMDKLIEATGNDPKGVVVEPDRNVGNGREFCYGEEERERFNRIVKCYVGSHNFHNFTTRTKAEDPAAWRYIVSFDAKTTVTVDGIEFVKCEVVGQSFMLHQIRKMIGLAVAVMRNCAPQSLIEMALRKDVHINVPTAPEVGLYLDECLFSSYNQKWKDRHEELSMKDYEEEAEEFKMKHIYTHIAATEHKEGVVGLWLHSLNHRNYPDLRFSNNRGDDTTKDGKSA